MNYASIKKHDVANGVGIRVSLFVSGCSHKCKGCFNAEAWDYGYGKKYTEETEFEILKALSPDYIKGFSLLGGEPLDPKNLPQTTSLLKKIREKFPQKDIWVYSGYVFETELKDCEALQYIDVLVDGRFVEEQKNLNLRFRGSENQRIIDVKRSFFENRTVLFDFRQSSAELCRQF